MHRLCVSALILALALAAFSEASWKPHHQRQEAPLPAEGVKRDLEPQWPDSLGPASHQRRQMGPQGPPHLVADLSKKAPWLEEEEEAYGWMDFGRRSAEDGDQSP